MPGEIIQRAEDSKVGRFIGSVQTHGQGLLHLVEDVESGFVLAFPSLKGWALAAQEVVQAVEDGIKDVEPTPAPVTPPPTAAPAEAPAAPTGALAAAGVDEPAPANAAPSAVGMSGTGLES